VRWLRDDRMGLEFAHETKIECAPQVRNALLLEVIRRSFPHVKSTTSAPAEAPRPIPARPVTMPANAPRSAIR